MTAVMAAVAHHTSGGKAYWYLTRSTGVVSLLLLTAVVILGMLGPMRAPASSRWPRFALGTLHRDLSLLVVLVLIIHIATTVLDGYAPIGWLDAVIPFRSAYRPLWLGLGALSFDLLLAIVATSLIRVRLGYNRWRAVHWLAYASWPIAVFHGLGTGTDGAQTWLLALTGACVLAVLGAVVSRVQRDPAAAARRPLWLSTAAVTCTGIPVFALVGPLSPHWTERAGTPASLIFNSTSSTAAGSGLLTSVLSGRMTRTVVNGGAVVDIELVLTGTLSGDMRVRLAGGTVQGGGISLVGSQVDLIAPAYRSVLTGTVTALSGQRFSARVSGGGHALLIDAALESPPGGGSVSGRLDAEPIRP